MNKTKAKSEKGKNFALTSISLCIIAVAIVGATGIYGVVGATPTSLSGELAIAGSTTVLPINQECARILMLENPELRISVSGGGSGHGVKAVGEGAIDIGAASRDVKSKEWETYPDLEPVVIGKDSVAIVVHPNNDVSELTLEQASKIFSGEITNWNELGGADAAIRIITREAGSGTREVFEKYVMKPFEREIAEEASVKSSNDVVRATVGRDEKSIGFLSIGYVDLSVKALKIDGVDATEETVLSGDYPISRNLYLVTKGVPSELEKVFIDFVVSEEGQNVVEDMGYIKLAVKEGGDILVGRAVLPANTFASGPTSGQFIGAGPINGVLLPFIEKQPVQGFSAILKKDDDSFYAMSDNGFGKQGNSQDYVLRVYEISPAFETAADGSGAIEVEGFIALYDPDELIPFTIVADLDEYPAEGTAPRDNITSGIPVDPAIKEDRLLTGADFDIESIQQVEDGTFWIGDEFGPFLLHVDADGKVLDSPIPLPNVSSPQNPYLEDPAEANLPRSRGFEGMALSVDGSKLYPMLEGALITDSDQTRRIINEFDLQNKSYTANQFYYRMEDPVHAIGDFIAVNEHEFMVIERDGSQGDLNGFKKIFKIDLSNLDIDSFVDKEEVVDLLNILDPDRIALPGDPEDVGLGNPFAFPFVTIEDVVIINSSTLGVLNDNNYPFSTGRNPNKPDDNEFILVKLDETLVLSVEEEI